MRYPGCFVSVVYLLGVLLMSWSLPSSGRVQSFDADRVIGQWVMPDGSALIEIFPINDSYAVRIVSLREPRFTVADNVEDSLIGSPRVDIHNPDLGLEQQSLLGLIIASELKYRNGSWQGGRIYDPGSGKSYRCELEWSDGGFLRVRGYLGISLFGRTMYWQRAADFKQRVNVMLEAIAS